MIPPFSWKASPFFGAVFGGLFLLFRTPARSRETRSRARRAPRAARRDAQGEPRGAEVASHVLRPLLRHAPGRQPLGAGAAGAGGLNRGRGFHAAGLRGEGTGASRLMGVGDWHPGGAWRNKPFFLGASYFWGMRRRIRHVQENKQHLKDPLLDNICLV